jgi:hypothetical protein
VCARPICMAPNYAALPDSTLQKKAAQRIVVRDRDGCAPGSHVQDEMRQSRRYNL